MEEQIATANDDRKNKTKRRTLVPLGIHTQPSARTLAYSCVSVNKVKSVLFKNKSTTLQKSREKHKEETTTISRSLCTTKRVLIFPHIFAMWKKNFSANLCHRSFTFQSISSLFSSFHFFLLWFSHLRAFVSNKNYNSIGDSQKIASFSPGNFPLWIRNHFKRRLAHTDRK